MSTRRADKIASQIQREISNLLLEQVNDPRLSGFLSITQVVVSSDLKYAKVFVSVLGDDVDKTEVQKGLDAATGFLRRELAPLLTMRQVPEITFHFDDSIEQAFEVMKRIDEVTAEDNKRNAGSAEK
ncbi:MAG TPA: 30S ribosome-binding factor RbfA [Dehalococcoidia bacterium]|nr:30S ribosome-binding factor RbfA [Dehalococcoidia bacterium]